MGKKVTKVENKLPSITCFVTTVSFNTKITEIENKTPYTSDLVKEN